MEARYTPQEALLVVDEALTLIARPECFTQGQWKCEVVDQKTGDLLCDKSGKQLYAYCIEGAINQATINVLGQARAVELGALTHKTGGEEPLNDDLDVSRATDALSLNQLADKLFADLTPDRGGTPSAQFVNDIGVTLPASSRERAKETAHNRVLRILRTKRDQLRRSLGSAAA